MTTDHGYYQDAASEALRQEMDERRMLASPADGPVSNLQCDHVSWRMNALIMTPALLILTGASWDEPRIQWLAGFTWGLYASMWLVIAWAMLSRRTTANTQAHP